MALNLARGAEAVHKAAERSSSAKFVPHFKWADKETKYLQFITPMEDIPTALFHNFIITGETEQGKPIYNSFISRKDEKIDGDEGYDPLVDCFGEKPTRRSIALAVELAPIVEQNGARKTIVGFDVVERQFERDKEGKKETVTVPHVALVIQSPQTFFGYLATFSEMKPIESTIFAVKRVGKSTDTRYDILEVPNAEPLNLDGILEEVDFDFDAYLEDLASEERMRELVGGLPDDWVVNPYSEAKKKASQSGKAGTTSRASRTRAAVAAAAEAEGEDGGAEEPQVEQPRASRSRRFSALEAELGAQPEADTE